VSRVKRSNIDKALDAYYLLDDDERTSFDVIRRKVAERMTPQLPAPRRKAAQKQKPAPEPTKE
jgi:hypothetical protein